MGRLDAPWPGAGGAGFRASIPRPVGRLFDSFGRQNCHFAGFLTFQPVSDSFVPRADTFLGHRETLIGEGATFLGDRETLISEGETLIGERERCFPGRKSRVQRPDNRAGRPENGVAGPETLAGQGEALLDERERLLARWDKQHHVTHDVANSLRELLQCDMFQIASRPILCLPHFLSRHTTRTIVYAITRIFLRSVMYLLIWNDRIEVTM